MYIANNSMNNTDKSFDWEAFFSQEQSEEILRQVDRREIFSNLRKHLQENKFRLTFALSKVMRNLLKGLNMDKNPRVLELGAATGFLTRWLISQYGGSGVLVDNSAASYKAFIQMQDNLKKNITYINEDIFKLELDETFHLVCSFGLIEHFEDKRAVLASHKKFLAPGGFIAILVPLDSPLTRAFLEVHPELNLGYRELVTEKELRDILNQADIEVVRTQVSWGYSYDFIGTICLKK